MKPLRLQKNKKSFNQPLGTKAKINSQEIAIIGMACRFPGANNYHKFWTNLINNVNSIQEIPKERWDINQYYSADRDALNKSVSKWGGLLDQIDSFDAPFFHISPREAMTMDPQQRLLLEETWHCIEDAGAPLKDLQKSKTSVYVGVMAIDYQRLLIGQNHVTDSYECLGNYEGILANRLSYFFDLTGESQSIDAACASSLVALHDAKRSILSGESDYAIAAGVSVICHPWRYISFSKSNMLSPDGQCKTFDAEANGYVPGEGVGVLLLCPLQKAIEKKFHIHGILKGSAVKHTGKSKSITAPRVEIEKQVIEEALINSKVTSEKITYVEAHGTGTSLGDPIEVEALKQAFNSNKKQYCYIGSVKTNIGHLEAASGVAGVIKVLLMMKHHKIPKTLNLKTVNTIINFENSPFRIADQLNDWHLVKNVSRRYAGVSSFGFGGVNAHVILAEYSKNDPPVPKKQSSPLPFILTARTNESLYELIREWKEYVKTSQFHSQSLENICHTILHGRFVFSYRYGITIKNKDDLVRELEKEGKRTIDVFYDTSKELLTKTTVLCLWDIASLNYLNFHKECQRFPILNQLVEECENAIFHLKDGKELLDKLYFSDNNQSKLLKALIVHFVLTKSLIKSGFRPQYLVDKGAGEFAQAVVGGMLDFDSAIQWIVGRKKQIHFKRPNIPLYDPHQSKVIVPYKVSKSYLEQLIDNIDVDAHVKNEILRNASQLIKHQYTFKKYLTQWQRLFNKTNINIEDSISNIDILKKNEQHLLIIVLVFCFKQLNLKWELSERITVNNDYHTEIVDLLLDNVLTHEQIVELLINPNAESYKKIAEHIQKHEYRLNFKKPYKLLKRLNQTLQKVADPTSWLHAILNDEAEDPEAVTRYTKQPFLVDIGENNFLNVENLKDTLPQFLIYLWRNGVSIDWKLWYPLADCQKVQLPTYPFAKEHYWISESELNVITSPTSNLPPLLDYNISTSETHKFSKLLTGKEFYLSDHQVDRCPVFPGAAYIEMAREAVSVSHPKQHVMGLRNIVWATPIRIMDQETEIVIIIRPESSGVGFQVNSAKGKNKIEQVDGSTESTIHAYGKIIFGNKREELHAANKLDISKIQSRCKEKPLQQIYAEYQSLGLNYGSSFQVIQQLLKNKKEVIAKLALPESVKYKAAQFILHPSLIDGALQAALELLKDKKILYLPYSVGKLDIYHPLQPTCYAYAEQTSIDESVPKFQIKILDESGKILIQLNDFTVRAIHKKHIEQNVPLSNQVTHQENGNQFSGQYSILSEVESQLISIVSSIFRINIQNVNPQTELKEYGMDSIGITELSLELDDLYGIELTPAILFEHKTLRSFAEYLITHYKSEIEARHKGMSSVSAETSKKQAIKEIHKKHIEQNISLSNQVTHQESDNQLAIQDSILSEVESQLVSMVSSIFRINIQNVSPQTELNEYGMDSIGITELSLELDDLYGIELTPAILFEHKTLRSFAEYLIAHYKPEIEAHHKNMSNASVATNEGKAKVTSSIPIPHSILQAIAKPEVAYSSAHAAAPFIQEVIAKDNDIAIIGMSGIFPNSPDLMSFWKNLVQGKDMISEIPSERWDWKAYYGDGENKTKVKWGGFVNEIDQFDTSFFAISPREAELMDPQQRVFLQTAWKAIEDAGYCIDYLSTIKTGVFVGVATNDYAQLLAQNNEDSAQVPTGTFYSLLANRVSYLLNLNGPSEAIDTACSSSLVAIHHAIKSIQNGDCDIAIAGGVNALLSPSTYLEFSKAGMLSEDGRCKTFDKAANGYVRGEGAGAILLKSLRMALADKDTIYGVIKGSAVNHGGRVNSLTVPNPNAQAEVIVTACERAGVSVDTINYIETHGTGTPLGDPIEVNGLKKAFEALRTKQQKPNVSSPYCGLGTVKTNIGHLEGAAGIAGVIKVLLALRYKILPGLVNFKELNPYVEINDSPFYLVEQTKVWAPSLDKNGQEIPRRAGISSFGFGGTNAHVVIEEASIPEQMSGISKPYYLITLSAKTEDALKERIVNLEQWLIENLENNTLEELSYTLNTGRSHFEKRCAIVVANLSELKENLQKAKENQTGSYVFINSKARDKSINHVIFKELFKTLMKDFSTELPVNEYRDKLLVLANFYVEGYDLDWHLLHQGEANRRISLPTYPFVKKRYWINETLKKKETINTLHPMIDSNESTFAEQLFKKVLRPQQFYLRDHIVDGNITLPGTGYLEIARAAGRLASGQEVTEIKDVVWLRPIMLAENDELAINIRLSPTVTNDSLESDFEIYCMKDNEKIVYCEGKLGYQSVNFNVTKLDIEEIRARCSCVIEKEEIYKFLKEYGFDYREAFRTSERFFVGENEALQEVNIPSTITDSAIQFYLHPSLLDGLLRSFLSFYMKNNTSAPLNIPFSLNNLKIKRPVNSKCYAYVRAENTKDIIICDESGEVIATIEGFNVREFKKSASRSDHQLSLYEPKWMPSQIEERSYEPVESCMIFIDKASFKETHRRALEKFVKNIIWINVGSEYTKIGDNEYQINSNLTNDYEQLFNELLKNKKMPHHFIDFLPSEATHSFMLSSIALFKALLKLGDNLGDMRCMIAFSSPLENDHPDYEAIAGLFHTIKIIKPSWHAISVQFDREAEENSSLISHLFNELMAEPITTGLEVRYQGESRLEKTLNHIDRPLEMPQTALVKSKGVYLITGGLGGIGRRVSEYLAEHYQAKLILIGRRPLSDEMSQFIKKLEDTGAEVLYEQGDIGELTDTRRMLEAAKHRFGKIDGIFHASGTLTTVPFLDASQEDVDAVIKPKAQGIINLDEVTQNEPLDFFVGFSSISAFLGDFSTGSYAVANRYIDSYLVRRERLRALNQRYGKSISINWPYWAEGGMQLPDDKLKIYSDHLGMQLLTTELALDTLIKLLSSPYQQTIVIPGNRDKVDVALKINKKKVSPEKLALKRDENEQTSNDTLLQSKTELYLKNLFAEVTKLDTNEIETTSELEAYGIDSIMILNLNNRLNQDFLDLRKTLLFEYRTLASLANYLIGEQRDKLEKILGLKKTLSDSTGPVLTPAQPSKILRFKSPDKGFDPSDKVSAIQDVAIIGISGRYPQADNLEKFWENLTNGKDCIEEIPSERWDYHAYYLPKRSIPCKTHSKWGGFIANADKFDPLFFNISPQEAERLDPQERLMLETAWHAIEDAGYDPKKLQTIAEGRVGVFVGSMWNEYQLLFSDREINCDLFGNSNTASIANRISYVLNLHGPSLVIDTACSSSLVAIHMACESIRHGECRYAIAGGVNLSLHPSKYVNMSQLGLLSTDGRCRSFGEGGDGYVPGEGVGAILLKPLSEALRDHDVIYGVIKGTNTNHGGKTNGITVPNPDEQANLIKEAMIHANVKPDTISYIEAHGTGTALGDPIEITGLTKAFGKGIESQSCPIGSVKSNVGHLEGTAGIVGVTKVLLQLKYNKLVPSIHSEELNQFIDFGNTPFKVQHEVSEWKPKPGFPRRAGISSFGATGTNAHVIIEEAPAAIHKNTNLSKPYYLITLSAKTENTLKQKIANLAAWIDKNPKAELEDISYTLNIGRSHFDKRCALVVSSLIDLQEKIEKLTKEQMPTEYYQGVAGKKKNEDAIYEQVFNQISEEIKSNNKIEAIQYKKKLTVLANLYVNGSNFDWKLLHQGEAHRKISLPTYPFAKERYWVTQNVMPLAMRQPVSAFLHPLIDVNISTLNVECFSKHLNKNEFYLNDHRVNEEPILPGVVYLEMARAASAIANPEQAVFGLRNITWVQPIRVFDQAKTITIALYPEENTTSFEVTSGSDTGEVLHAQGKVKYSAQGQKRELGTLDIALIKERALSAASQETLYSAFNALGLQYGPSFKVIKALWSDGKEVMAVLTLPNELSATKDQFLLHPSLLDGVLQTIAGLFKQRGINELYLPFSMSEMEFVGSLPATCYVHSVMTSKEDNQLPRFDIKIADESGKVTASIKEFTVRALQKEEKTDVYYYQPVWKAEEIVEIGTPPQGSYLVLDGTDELASMLKEKLPQQTNIHQYKIEDAQQAIKDLARQNQFPAIIVYRITQVNELATVYTKLLFLSKTLIEAKPKDDVRLLCISHSALTSPAIASYLKTLAIECPKLKGRVVQITENEQLPDVILSELNANEIEIRYGQGKRWVKAYEEISAIQEISSLPLKQQGVYWITGGMGGLGIIFARFLAEHCQAKLILMGRSLLKENQQAMISELEKLGSDVMYVSGDVSKSEDVEEIFKSIKTRFGKLDGIIHSAGVLNDAFILKKTQEESLEVLSPKTAGTIHLDQITANEPLDFFVMFSSIASVLGNVGQSDYSFANGFMDGFAEYRDHMQRKGERQGKTTAINWPLWSEGGMQLNEASKVWLQNTLGALPLSTEEGIKAFTKAITENKTQFIVLNGQHKKLNKLFDKKKVKSNKEIEPILTAARVALLKKVQMKLLEIVSQTLKINSENLHIEENLSEYGVDSISFTVIVNKLNQNYTLELTPAIFFEHQTLRSFAEYLTDNYLNAMIAYHGSEKISIEATSNTSISEKIELKHPRMLRYLTRNREIRANDKNDIAIIGMSGVFPGSPDLAQFWNNIKEQKDLISEIPKSRWRWEDYYGVGVCNTKVKWGGFMDGIENFDASFFAISPGEAELMDPQQRLFLQVVWKTIEDAGYTPNTLSTIKTGIFVGVSTHDYMDILRDAGQKSAYVSTGNAHSVLANRISYLLNFSGPSEAVDTACSSSLVALHRAVQSIQAGDCDTAVVGGVNALLSPSLYFSFTNAGMLCEDGRCKTFDKSANGYVRGEGVGAILIKPLEKALADSDKIYGVIKGCAVNHGGHVSSLTVPNPNAQAQLIVEACERGNIDVDTISYVEAHGTGTSLGDPIEVNGLKKAFEALRTKQQKSSISTSYCGLGSVKTNIGHLEAAAGIAGVIKVLLAMQHKTLPGLANFKELNPYVEIKGSPFYLVEQTKEWSRLLDKNGQEIPRRAGISSFGFGGTNAHVVIEEAPVPEQKSSVSKLYYLITLSAKTEDALKERIVNLEQWLIENQETHTLEDLSYTLNTGRSHFEKRCAIVASNLTELKESLQKAKEDKTVSNVFINSKVNNKLIHQAIFKELFKTLIKDISSELLVNEYRDKLLALANFYAEGYDLDWNKIHQGETHRKISLPTYPFAKDRYWISQNDMLVTMQQSAATSVSALMNQNESKDELFNFLIKDLGKLLGESPDVITKTRTWFDFGMDSIMLLHLAKSITEYLNNGRELTLEDLYKHQTIDELMSFLDADNKKVPQSSIDERPVNGEQQKLPALIPPSIQQNNLWLLLRDYKDNPAYNVQVFRLFKETPNETLLSKALKQTILAINILKTSFKIVENYIYPIVNEGLQINIQLVPIELTNEHSLEDTLAETIYNKANICFDIENSPLFKIYLLKINENKFGLLIILHHMICDDISAEILMRKIEDNYLALLNPAKTPIANEQNYDYATYIQNTLSNVNKNLAATIQYMNKIGQHQANDYARDKKLVNSNAPIMGMVEKITLDNSIHDKVYHFCQRNKISAYTFFLGIYGLTLAEYTRQKNIYLLAIRSGRHESSIKEAIGSFVDGVPLLIKVGDAIKSYFQQIEANLLNALDSNPGPIPFSQLNSHFIVPKFTYNFYTSPYKSAIFINETKDYVADSIIERTKLPYWNYKDPEHLYLMVKDLNKVYSCYLIGRSDLYRKENIGEFANLFVQHCEIVCKVP